MYVELNCFAESNCRSWYGTNLAKPQVLFNLLMLYDQELSTESSTWLSQGYSYSTLLLGLGPLSNVVPHPQAQPLVFDFCSPVDYLLEAVTLISNVSRLKTKDSKHSFTRFPLLWMRVCVCVCLGGSLKLTLSLSFFFFFNWDNIFNLHYSQGFTTIDWWEHRPHL